MRRLRRESELEILRFEESFRNQELGFLGLAEIEGISGEKREEMMGNSFRFVFVRRRRRIRLVFFSFLVSLARPFRARATATDQ